MDYLKQIKRVMLLAGAVFVLSTAAGCVGKGYNGPIYGSEGPYHIGIEKNKKGKRKVYLRGDNPRPEDETASNQIKREVKEDTKAMWWNMKEHNPVLEEIFE